MAVKMKVPEGCSGCSFAGENFKPSRKGFVTVPEEAVAELIPHGFVVDGAVVEEPPDEMEQQLAVAKEALDAAQAALDACTDDEQQLAVAKEALDAAQATYDALNLVG